MIILFFSFIFFITYFYFFFKKRTNNVIILKLKKEIPINIDKNNENDLFEFLCENIEMNDFKIKLNDIIKQYNIIVVNRTLFENSFNIPNGYLFQYFFNHESMKMLFNEGIFSQVNLNHIKIPIFIYLSNNTK